MSQQLELLTENPAQWNAVKYVTPEIQRKEIKPFVVLALKELEGNPDSRVSSLMNADKFAAVRAVVRHMARLRSASKDPWGVDDVSAFVESLRFSPECIKELTSLLCTEKMYDNIPTHLRSKPGLVSLTWKIDLSLSQANLKSGFSPQQSREVIRRDTHIVLCLSLTDGRSLSYRLSVQKFHELRYVVAGALKNMIVLERRKCMKN